MPSTENDRLRQRLGALRRRWWLVVAPMVIAGILAGLLAASEKNVYEAQANLLFKTTSFDQLLFGRAVFAEPPSTPTAAIDTNIRLLSQRRIGEIANRRLKLGFTSEELQRKVSVTQQGDSNLVTLGAQEYDPKKAALIANVWAASFLDFQRSAQRRPLLSAAASLRERLASLPDDGSAQIEEQAIASRLSDLETLSQIQTPQAQVTQRATPPDVPVSPRPLRDAVIGAVLGLLLGILLGLLFERFDRRLRNTEDLEEAFGMPLLAGIPDSKSLTEARTESKDLSHADVESFRGLRTHLRYFDVDRTISTVLVTSAAAQDGKSTVSWNLARSSAESGSRAILVEIDFHRPTFAKRRGLEPLPGVSELLSGQATLERVIQKVPLGNQTNGAGTEGHLDVIVSGAAPPNRTEILESAEMAKLVQDLGTDYDLLVLDMPPATVISDVIPLMRLVDGVIVVGQIGKTTRDEAARLNNQLREFEAPILGVVANRVRSGAGYYGYYGYGAPEERSAVAGLRIGSRS
jgi:succinoglycan biosynthesis transport protein ExoP